jgi:uncharacterized protein DUF5565
MPAYFGDTKMKKIPTIFQRDWHGDRSRVLGIPNSEAAWVFAGEGVATRKMDGSAVLIQYGKLFVRYDAKNGKKPPADFMPAQEKPDEETGHWPGWVPAGEKPQYQWQRVAFENSKELTSILVDGTYEAIGPHFQGNPERVEKDILTRHGAHGYLGVPVTFDGLREWFEKSDMEGIVWHHQDGRMAKIKAKDFGLKRIEV